MGTSFFKKDFFGENVVKILVLVYDGYRNTFLFLPNNE